ncbi:MAG: ribosomal protein S18-alanine N-acetyltransferase [Longimicrobiales bacterium]
MGRLTTPVGSVSIRPMAERDVDAVSALENVSFSSPWRADTFHALLARPPVVLLVLEEDGVVAGYAVVWCILDQGELSNIAVDPARRGRGLGTRILDHALEVARSRGVTSMYLEVRVSNRVAADLYRRRGFVEVGRRRDYYDNPREDAILMVADLEGPSGHPAAPEEP